MIKSCLISLMLIGLTVGNALANKSPVIKKAEDEPFFSWVQKADPDAQKPKSQMFNVEAFDEISINGPISVEIIGNTPLHDVRVVGTKNYVDCVKVESYKNRLHVSLVAPEGKKGRALVIIRTGKVTDMNLVGRGTIKAIGLGNSRLNIQSEYNGLVDISGNNIELENLRAEAPGILRMHGISTSSLKIKANENNVIKLNKITRLARLDYSGNGTIELTPVKSHYLHVTGRGMAKLMAHGLVDILELTLHGSAVFDGRELKTHTAYATTYNVAQAHLNVVKAQHAFADDNSDILFYNNAHFIGSHMMASGAVLNYGRIEMQPES